MTSTFAHMSPSLNVLRFAKISLICVFIVIIAGSVVRITGSGMGCPDWPFCFGYVVPPTSVEPLTFSPDRSFHEGQMIIHSDTLWVANDDFTTKNSFERNNWHKYAKHDYAVFNATHTWIEYINRLATGVLGFPCMILLFISFIRLIKTKEWITFLLALFTVFGLGFEAWLGKLVVDGNLKENSITYHMLGTMVIIALLIAIIIRHSESEHRTVFSMRFKLVALAMLVLSVTQVILGTQVREEIDIIAKNIDDRSGWIAQLSSIFFIHRSFAYLLVACAAALIYMNRKLSVPLKQINLIAAVLLLEIAGGVVLSYLDMPKLMQPLHLLLGIMLFALSFFIVLAMNARKTKVIAQP